MVHKKDESTDKKGLNVKPDVEYLEYSERKYKKLGGEPLKAEELLHFEGTIIGKSKTRFGWMVNCSSGQSFYCTTKLEQLLIDNWDNVLGHDVYINFLGSEFNENTGQTFKNFEVGII